MERSTRNLRQRGLVLLLVAGLLLASAAPALAKPGSGKPEEPKQYTVTMAGALATTCPGFAPSVTMTGFGNVIEGRTQNLETDINVAWTRRIDLGYGTSGDSLTGCHGNALPPNENVLYAMWITLDPKGQQVKVQWRFDPAFDAQGNPQELFELLSLSDPNGSKLGKVTWADGVVNGWFLLRRWNSGESWTDLGRVHLTFELTIVQA